MFSVLILSVILVMASTESYAHSLKADHAHKTRETEVSLREYETYYENGFPRYCLTRNDSDPCPPDHQIEICSQNRTKVRCVRCKPGLRQCDKTTSELNTRCYDPSSYCSGHGDNVVKVVDIAGGGCTIQCVCNEINGYSGTDPTQCTEHDSPCTGNKSRYLNGRECLPCPTGFHNPSDDGIDQCMPQSAHDTTSTTVSVINMATSKDGGAQVVLPVTTQNPMPKISQSNEAKMKEEIANGDKMRNISGQNPGVSWYVWVLIAIGVGLLIIIGLCICIYFRCSAKRDQKSMFNIQICIYNSGNNDARNEVNYTERGDQAHIVPLIQHEGEDIEPQEQSEPQGHPASDVATKAEDQSDDDDTLPGHRTAQEHDEGSATGPRGNGQPGCSGQQAGHRGQEGQNGDHGHQPRGHEGDLAEPCHGGAQGPDGNLEHSQPPVKPEFRLPGHNRQPGQYDPNKAPRYRAHSLPPPYSTGLYQPLDRENPEDRSLTGPVIPTGGDSPSLDSVTTADLFPVNHCTITSLDVTSHSSHTSRPDPDATCTKTILVDSECETGQHLDENPYASHGPHVMELDQNLFRGQERGASSSQSCQLTEPKRKL